MGLAALVVCGLCTVATSGGAQAPAAAARATGLTPGARVLLDAHNAYPEAGLHADRLPRAMATGLPVAIEQDLVWVPDPRTGLGRSVVSHGGQANGQEPTLEDHFFKAVAPVVERALRENRRERWPLIVLNLDFKTNEPAHHAAVWALLGRYERWLTTARRTGGQDVSALEPGPVLVLTGEADEQEEAFHARVPVGGRLRLFGAVHSRLAQAGTAAADRVRSGAELPDLTPQARTNYRRWWNLPWNAVELGGQNKAGDWTTGDDGRLRRLVHAAHDSSLWIRFYTLDGHDPADTSGGWTQSYTFGSLQAVRARWEAAIAAGVDFVAVDQYEAFAAVLARLRGTSVVAARLDGVLTRAAHETLFEREFEVPPGTDRIDVDLYYDGEHRTVLDLGLRGPAGIRGWSGGGPQQIFVGAHTASFGYTPGPIEPGTWAVVLGVPNIREGVRAPYTITVRTAAAGGSGWPVLRDAPGWYAGDLHAHSGHSDGRTLGGLGERLHVPASHVFDAARTTGLDFVALTDHNTSAQWADVDRLQALYSTVLLLHGREITTYRGHFNALGERRFVDFRLSASRSVAALAGELTAGGALLSINHPRRPDDETCMGCGWNDLDAPTIGAMQAVEVVNGGLADGPESGWAFWAARLNQGHRLAAVGGSDEHTPDDTRDGRLGRPTTVVYATELSEAAILDGIRTGRTYVRTRSAEGPTLDFWASTGQGRVEMGGTAAPGPLTLHASIGRAAAHRFEWIRNGAVVSSGEVPADGRVTHALDARAGDWFSLNLRDADGPTLMSGALYTQRP